MIGINKLIFGYKRKKQLFNNLNLTIEKGNIYGLLGKNGAGKTTLLKIIAGLLYPDEGTCNVLNYTPKKRNPHFLSELFFIPENFYIPPIKIEFFCLMYAPFYPKFNKDHFFKLLDEFSISRSALLSTLSYGQKKKFLLAFGVATNCSLFILDEPTNGLDIPSKSIFRKILASSLSENRIILISTHQVRDMENLIDPILILDEGEIIFSTPLYKVYERLTIKKVAEEKSIKDVLYKENLLDGYLTLVENRTKKETMIDLEFLFNAVIENSTKIKSILNSEVKK